MLQYSDGIDIQTYYKQHRGEFLGFLPLIDDGIQYYTVDNIGTNKDYERVSPIYGEVNETVVTDLEYWYQKDISKKSTEDNKLQHEYYREEFLERLQNNKYCVWFIGCDDGDYFMRFKDKEEALEFLNSISSFDEVYDHEHSMMW